MNKLKFLVINGPNLNMLGIREPSIYGNFTYPMLCDFIQEKAETMKIETSFFQSNHEGDIIDKIHEAYQKFDGIVINPGAFTHYSYAILDALKAVAIPTAEVHISDVNEREEFRKISVVRPACCVTVSGRGYDGYIEAIAELAKKIIN
ncbi:MAG: type II 3-dehydroquinate dehydratase [Ruminococcaceae bacterium]|nr:type II 3-dehydroquinate dehydratase [Oscillospiraceae bacterium]